MRFCGVLTFALIFVLNQVCFSQSPQAVISGRVVDENNQPLDGIDNHVDPSKIDVWAYSYRSVQRPSVRVREHIVDDVNMRSLYWRFNDQYDAQLGVGSDGDLLNDFKFQYGAAVVRGGGLEKPQYAIYGSLWVQILDDDPGGGTRTFPPFQGNPGGQSGGPIFTLKGKPVDMFIELTATRPGTILELGDVASFAGHIAPPLPSKVEITVTFPSGKQRIISGQANHIGYFYNPGADFVPDETGSYRVKVKVWHEGTTSAGKVQPPFPSGDVLGSSGGEFSFYVVDTDTADLQVNLAQYSYVRPGQKPVVVEVKPQAGLQNVQLHYTMTMPGFILDQGVKTDLSLRYDPVSLNKDFPNLDVRVSGGGRTVVDLISLTFLVTGRDAQGKTLHQARRIDLLGEELFALTWPPFRLDFPHFASSGEITSTFVIINPSPTQKVTGAVHFFESDGRLATIGLNGTVQNGRLDLTLPANGLGFFATDSKGDLKTGSAWARSTLPLEGTILFSGPFGVAGVPSSPASTRFFVPIEYNKERSISSGVALSNPDEASVTLSLTLRNAEGTRISQQPVSLQLPPNGQIARFPDQLFPGGTDFSQFRGSLEISAPKRVSGIAIRLNPGEFATLPVISASLAQSTLRFGHFGDGAGITSSLILVNPFPREAAGLATMRTDQGKPLIVDVNGAVQSGSFNFKVPPLGVAFYQTDGLGDLVSGSLEVSSDIPIGGVLLFSGNFGTAGVGAGEPRRGLLVPIESDRAKGIQTGVALYNTDSISAEVTLRLRTTEGQEIPNSTRSLTLDARGHIARFPEDLFSGLQIDLSKFLGLLEVRSSTPLVGMALRLSPAQFATVPVTPIR